MTCVYHNTGAIFSSNIIFFQPRASKWFITTLFIHSKSHFNTIQNASHSVWPSTKEISLALITKLNTYSINN